MWCLQHAFIESSCPGAIGDFAADQVNGAFVKVHQDVEIAATAAIRGRSSKRLVRERHSGR